MSKQHNNKAKLPEPVDDRQLYQWILTRLGTYLLEQEQEAKNNLLNGIEVVFKEAKQTLETTEGDLNRVGAYVVRDFADANKELAEIKQAVVELANIEEAIFAESLLSAVDLIADRARVEWDQISKQLVLMQAGYHSGELTVWPKFSCKKCGSESVQKGLLPLEKCDACGSHELKKVVTNHPD